MALSGADYCEACWQRVQHIDRMDLIAVSRKRVLIGTNSPMIWVPGVFQCRGRVFRISEASVGGGARRTNVAGQMMCWNPRRSRLDQVMETLRLQSSGIR